MRIIKYSLAVLLFVGASWAQVTVAIAPNPHPQFTDGRGVPLANGFLFTYQAGTTTQVNTYIDSTGTTQNPDPIPLDSTGSPSNGSTQTGIWLANQAYKFCAYNATMVQQWCTDNVTGYLGLLNTPNTWTFQQTFTQPLIDTQTDNQIIVGAQGGNQTTLDFPPPNNDMTLHFPNTGDDTIVARNTTETLSNKNLAVPQINGITIQNTPGTYISMVNGNPTGPIGLRLAMLTIQGGQAVATVATTSTSSGIVGVCTLNCTNSGSSQIQTTGGASCQFDGPTTANDAVIASTAQSGECHDAGTLVAANSIGVVNSTNAAGGIYQITLGIASPPGTGAISSAICADGTTSTVNNSTTSVQQMKICPIPSALLNSIGKTFRLTAVVTVSPNTAITSQVGVGLGTTNTPPLAQNIAIATQPGSATTWQASFSLTCTTYTVGAVGNLQCNNAPTVSPSAGVNLASLSPGFTFVNLTGPLYVDVTCNFSGASSLNSCNEMQLIVQQLN